jgi:hypothetical protein
MPHASPSILPTSPRPTSMAYVYRVSQPSNYRPLVCLQLRHANATRTGDEYTSQFHQNRRESYRDCDDFKIGPRQTGVAGAVATPYTTAMDSDSLGRGVGRLERWIAKSLSPGMSSRDPRPYSSGVQPHYPCTSTVVIADNPRFWFCFCRPAQLKAHGLHTVVAVVAHWHGAEGLSRGRGN